VGEKTSLLLEKNGDVLFYPISIKNRRAYMDSLLITLDQDKEPFIKELTKDEIINLTGESGSGKSYYTNQFMNNSNYIIVDTDEVFSRFDNSSGINRELGLMFRNKYRNDIPNIITDFDICYKDILDYFKDQNKTIVIDSAQFRNVKDLSIIKGKLIVMRTCVNTCYERCIKRWNDNHPNASDEEMEKYATKKKQIYNWYHSINDFLMKLYHYKAG